MDVMQVLHATPSLHETLVNIRKLLQPKGKLLLQELCSSKSGCCSFTTCVYLDVNIDICSSRYQVDQLHHGEYRVRLSEIVIVLTDI